MKVVARRECLELFVNIHDSIAKIEKLLHIGEELDRESPPGQKEIGNILMKAGTQDLPILCITIMHAHFSLDYLCLLQRDTYVCCR